MEMNGSFGMMDRPAEIPEHLNIVEVKCEEVNENVSKVLKFLCAFNLRKLTKNCSYTFGLSKKMSSPLCV